MSFAVLARFPLGVYRGHRPDGSVDSLPSPARLHAALLCAAAQGPRAELVEDELRPAEDDQRVLEWLEQHPPDGLVVPQTSLNTADSIAHRRNGLVRKEGRGWSPWKTEGKAAVGSVAVDGAFGWTWEQSPPADVRTALGDLCRDVTHLGEAESVTVLRTGEATATVHLDADSDLFGPAGMDVQVPTAGRTAALSTSHAAQARPIPGVAQDSHRSSEASLLAPVSTQSVRVARYRAPHSATAQSPWVSAIVIPFNSADSRSPWTCQPHERVRWSVAVHRALISLVGDGAPSVLTGAYAEGVRRPANRIAVHVIPRKLRSEGQMGTEVVILIPEGVDPTELAVIVGAASRMNRVREKKLGRLEILGAGEFWAAPAPDRLRLWRADPVAVPDTRPPRGKPEWTVGDAALLSVGLLHRDLWRLEGRGGQWYRAVAAEASNRGVQVVHAQRAPGLDVGRYVHKAPRGHIVQPYYLWLRAPAVLPDRAIMAVGQSRHLGGGLLVPYDVPAGE